MLKKFNLLVLIIFLMGCASANNVPESERIPEAAPKLTVSKKPKAVAKKSYAFGIVDLERVLKNSVPGKSAQADLKKQKDKMKTDLKQKGAEIEQLRRRLEREARVMSKEVRVEKEREARIKLNDFKRLQMRYRSDLQKLEKELIGQLKVDVFTLANEIGKKEGYLLIISKTVVLYSRESIDDLTGKIIKRLNKKYPE
jgi:outer membrane protein